MPSKYQTGQETYLDRIRVNISLLSPSGIEFEAKFISDERSKSKLIQKTNHIGKNGAYTKDHGTDSPDNNYSIFFDGDNCDKNAKKFFDACDEIGQWNVNHPIYGPQSLQLLTVKQKNDLVKSLGVIEFELSWIKPKNEENKKTAKELKTLAEYEAEKIGVESALSFADKIRSKTEALRKNIQNFTDKYTGIIDNALDPIAAISDMGYTTFLTAKQSLKDFKYSTVGRVTSLAGQFQTMANIAFKSNADITKKKRASNKIIEDIFKPVIRKNDTNESAIFGIKKDDTGINNLAFIELLSTSAICGSCLSVINEEITSADQAIENMDFIEKQKNDVISKLETVQFELNQNQTNEDIQKPIDEVFVSLDKTIEIIDNLVYLSKKFLMVQALNSGPKKKLTIKEDISTLVFYIKYYKKTTGFFEFCETNKLARYEIFFLKQGKEIQV